MTKTLSSPRTRVRPTGGGPAPVLLATSILVALVATEIVAAPLEPQAIERIDALFADWDRWDAPGAALAIVRGGEIVYRRGYGLADLEQGTPITPSTIFHVASVSKQFTDFAITLLAGDGKLSLDDPIQKYIPEVPDFGETITLRHLAHHTSGIRDQWELLAMAGWRLDDVITKDQILRLVSRQRALNFPPGSEYVYSNTGFTLLAEVVARVSGQSFDEFCQERIFRPLSMSRSHFHDDHEHLVPGRAYSYVGEQGRFAKSVLSYANAGATSLFTTVEDLARWLVNLDTGTVGGVAVLEQMHRRGVLATGEEIDYALGLMYSTHRGLQVVGHSGGDAGFRSWAGRFPEHDLGVVVLSNVGGLNPSRKATAIAEILLEEHLEPVQATPGAPPAQSIAERIELTAETLERFVGAYHLDNDMLVRITLRGRRLMAELPGLDAVEMVPVAERTFLVPEIEGRVVFDATTGRFQSFAIEVPTQSARGERLEPQSSVALAQLEGEYWSPELQTSYRLQVEGEVIRAHHQRHDPIDLVQLGNDELAGNQWWFAHVALQRNSHDAVEGFRLSGGRVRNLWFERVQRTGAAQPPPFTLTGSEQHLLHSDAIGQTFEISVALPGSYGSSDQRYPVLYTLDANWGFASVVETARLASFGNEMREVIVVGIGYRVSNPMEVGLLRSRDYTPTIDEQYEDRERQRQPELGASIASGGAPAFLDFVTSHVQPLVNSRYRTLPAENVLFGDSFGGLFALYSLFHRPESFRGYLIGSPSIWWHDEVSLHFEEEWARTHQDLEARVFLAVGELEEPTGDSAELIEARSFRMVTNVGVLAERLRSRNYPSLDLSTVTFDDETHLSVVPATTSRGLRTLLPPRPSKGG